MRQITIRIKKENFEKLQTLAKNDSRSFTNYVDLIFDKFLKDLENGN